MAMFNQKIEDPEIGLTTPNKETFCQEYVRLDIEESIINSRARRIKAFRIAYENNKDTDGSINSRASMLLRDKDIIDRINFLYEQHGTSVENKHKWNKDKSIDLLANIAYDSELKPDSRIKAIVELNKMIGIDKPQVEIKEEEDGKTKIGSFFGSILSKKEESE